ncbi:MAG: FliH/SctL family protein [Anaerovoracaceae bacterium]
MENLIKEYKYQDFTASFDNTFQGGNETAVEYTYNDIAALDTDFSEQDDYEADAEETEIIRDSSLEISEEEAKHIIKDAEAQAASIIKEAMDTAERVKKDAFVEAGAAASEAQTTGYNEGYEKGLAEGREQAVTEARAELDEKNRFLLEEISRAIAELDRQKIDYIRMYNEEMKDLVIAIAEKVINVSLKSSGEIIRRMILNAVENSNEKQWAKVFISESDAHIMVNEDSDILDALRKVSDNIKIEVMENGEQGDLLIEYPDQVVDAGVNTQLTNIRRIMDEVN